VNALPTTRRTFLKQAATVAATLAGGGLSWAAAERNAGEAVPSRALPWYRRTLRWGQTNITEIDPSRYDIAWWRQHWKRTQTQGVIINAGGIVAYYPSTVPLHRPAQHLGGRDLFGELCRAAHEDGLVVFARMDSNRAHEELYRAHPGWFAVDAESRPYKAGELFITCVNEMPNRSIVGTMSTSNTWSTASPSPRSASCGRSRIPTSTDGTTPSCWSSCLGAA